MSQPLKAAAAVDRRVAGWLQLRNPHRGRAVPRRRSSPRFVCSATTTATTTTSHYPPLGSGGWHPLWRPVLPPPPPPPFVLSPPPPPVASGGGRSGRRGFTSGSDPIRKAGRQRFYRLVSVAACPAPWATAVHTQSVASPISAGVDGTDSASGVVHRKAGHHHCDAATDAATRRLLVPRTPAPRLLMTTTTRVDFATLTHDEDDDGHHPVPLPSWYTVTLDGRSLRTPMGQPLAVPSARLAHGIAVEWNNVDQVIQPSQMPLMTLTCTALDQVCHVPAVESYRRQCLSYLHTDTVCYWVDPTEDRVLHRKQQAAWKDLHEWMAHDFGAGLPRAVQTLGSTTDEGLQWAQRRRSQTVRKKDDPLHTNSSPDGTSVGGLPHLTPLEQAAQAWIASLDGWHLTVLHSACAEAKSFWLATAVVTQKLDANHAQMAARVEEEFQIESWGLVEGQHDYDRLNSAVQLRAASLMATFLNDATVADAPVTTHPTTTQSMHQPIPTTTAAATTVATPTADPLTSSLSLK